nr:Do family serine endopeptidase [Rhizobium halophytocola]
MPLPMITAVSIALAPIGSTAAHAQAPVVSPQPGHAATGPAPVADLAEKLLDAVVNISTSQNVKSGNDEGPGPLPQIEEGSPFQDLFEDFFKNGERGEQNRRVNSLGSGFVIDPSGYIVTNNHVIEDADDIEAVFADGTKLKARLIGTDTKTDLSVLKVEPKNPLPAVKLGDSRKMRIGDWVMAIGNPFGLGGTVTLGIISARGRNINAGPYDNFIQTDAAINKGNSGGPLFNMDGDVIGINTAIISPSGGSIGIGFSVPTELASTVIDQLIEYGETRRGWLGVRIQPVDEDIAKDVGLDKPRGALVSGVIKGGPVENGPIVVGDVILTFDGKAVTDAHDLVRVVAESPIERAVDVVVLRDKKEQTVKVKLGRLEESAKASEAVDKADDEDAGPEPSMPDEPQTDEPQMEEPQTDGPDGTAPDGAVPDQPMPEPAPGDSDQQQSPGETDPGSNLAATLGLSIAALDDSQREIYGISESVEGVVITDVAQGSTAAERGLAPGDVIVEVSQDFMQSPDAVDRALAKLKDDGRRSAHMMVAKPEGDLRFVALPLE